MKIQTGGGGRCSLCASPGTTRTNCPYNPYAERVNFRKHPNATDESKWSSRAQALRAAGGQAPQQQQQEQQHEEAPISEDEMEALRIRLTNLDAKSRRYHEMTEQELLSYYLEIDKLEEDDRALWDRAYYESLTPQQRQEEEREQRQAEEQERRFRQQQEMQREQERERHRMRQQAQQQEWQQVQKQERQRTQPRQRPQAAESQAAESQVDLSACKNTTDYFTMDPFTEEDKLVMDQDGHCYTTESIGGMMERGLYVNPVTRKPLFSTCAQYKRAMHKANVDSKLYLGKISLDGKPCGSLYTRAALMNIPRYRKLFVNLLEDVLMIVSDHTGGEAALSNVENPDYVYAQKLMDKYTGRLPSDPINPLLDALLYLGDAKIKTFTDFFEEVRSGTSCSHAIAFKMLKSILVGYTIYFKAGIGKPFLLPPCFHGNSDYTNIIITTHIITETYMPALIMYKFNEKNEKDTACNWLKTKPGGRWIYKDLTRVARKIYGEDDEDAVEKLKLVFESLGYNEEVGIDVAFRFVHKYENNPEFFN